VSGRVTLALAATIAASACSAYTPVTMATVPSRGADRLFLTDAGRSERLGALGSEVTSVEGEVKSIGDSAFTIAVDEIGRQSADPESFHGQLVTIPSRLIARIERKHVQVARSLIIAAALAGGALWVGSQGHGDVSLGPSQHPPTSGQ